MHQAFALFLPQVSFKQWGQGGCFSSASLKTFLFLSTSFKLIHKGILWYGCYCLCFFLEQVLIDLFGSMCRKDWGRRKGIIWGVPLSSEQDRKMLLMKSFASLWVPCSWILLQLENSCLVCSETIWPEGQLFLLVSSLGTLTCIL